MTYVVLKGANEAQDPQFIAQITAAWQHKNSSAGVPWPGPDREPEGACRFRGLRQNRPGIAVATRPFKTIADEAQAAPLLAGNRGFGLLGDDVPEPLVSVRTWLIERGWNQSETVGCW